ncbi:hypothetical protein Tco_1469937 [Tanacetum coccineum]
MMYTPLFVNPESSTQADRAQSSRVPAPFPEDPYEAIRQACLVDTDAEFEPSEDPIDTETPESPHAVASPTPFPDSTPPACHTKESEDSDTSGVRSTSSDSTAPLSPDHLLTRTLPTPTPTRASFHRRTARMTVRAQPVMSPGHSARVAEAMALSDSALRKSEVDEIGEEGTDEDEGHGLDDEGHGLDDESHSMESDGLGLEVEEEVAPEGQQRAVSVVGATTSAPLGLGYGALRRRELAVEEDQPPLTTLIDPEDAPSAVSSPMISLTVPSPIASPVTAPTATIPVDEDQFIEIGRPVLALEAWVGHVDTRMSDMSRAEYDDHRLVHDMLVQQAALQRELQEMRGRATTLEQERDHRKR